MSVQVTVQRFSPSNLHDSATKKSKKRKLETPEKVQLSSKKRKHLEAEDGVAGPGVAEQSLEKSSAKKKRKKSKHTEVTAVPIINGTITEEDTELLDVPGVSGDTRSETTSPQDANQTGSAYVTNIEYPFGLDFLDSADPSCFYATRLSLNLSIPAVSLSTARQSILSAHLAPLLLTYFPPAKGIVLAFSDPILSAKPDFGVNLPLQPPRDGTIPEKLPEEIMLRAADEFGACRVWLTATFLVFRPERGDKLHGWSNVMSQGFVGLISYNYFQTAIGKLRIPEKWTWNGPTREQKKRARRGKLRDESSGNWPSQSSTVVDEEIPQETQHFGGHFADGAGYFSDDVGVTVPDTLTFRIVETEMHPEKDKWSLQIQGTLLDNEAEQKVLEEERIKFERSQNQGKTATPRPDAVMSGGLGQSHEGSTEADSPEHIY